LVERGRREERTERGRSHQITNRGEEQDVARVQRNIDNRRKVAQGAER